MKYSVNSLYPQGLNIRKLLSSFCSLEDLISKHVTSRFLQLQGDSVRSNRHLMDTATLFLLQLYVVFIAHLLPHLQYFTTMFHNLGNEPKQY